MPVAMAAALLFQVQDLRKAEKPCPYTVVTTAGERVGSLDPPKRDGKPVKFRDCRNQALTLFPAAEVDWPATEAANSSGPAKTPTAGPAYLPTKPSLSGLAKAKSLDAEAAVRQNQTLSGKMKIGGREISLDESTPFFGSDSVARYVELSAFLADATGCPASRARAYGSVKNISRFKLRNLRALVVIGSLRSGDANGQVQSMDPSDLVPGEESEIFLWLSCDWAGRSMGYGYKTQKDYVLVAIADVAGKTEEVAKPDGTSPFEKPEPTKAAAPAKTPTPGPLGNAPLRPR